MKQTTSEAIIKLIKAIQDEQPDMCLLLKGVQLIAGNSYLITLNNGQTMLAEHTRKGVEFGIYSEYIKQEY